MSIKKSISVYDFRQAFSDMGRGEQFSYEGLGVLYEALTNSDADIEMDVIAFCCEFSEGAPKEIADDYGIELQDDGNELNNVLDYLHDHTFVCGVTEEGLIVYQQF